MVGWRNLKNFRIGSQLKPIGKLSVRLDHHSFWLAEKADGLYNVAGRRTVAAPEGGAADAKVGDFGHMLADRSSKRTRPGLGTPSRSCSSATSSEDLAAYRSALRFAETSGSRRRRRRRSGLRQRAARSRRTLGMQQGRKPHRLASAFFAAVATRAAGRPLSPDIEIERRLRKRELRSDRIRATWQGCLLSNSAGLG